MSFDKAIAYTTKYLRDSAKAQNNERRMSWFTTNSTKLSQLFTDTFSTDEDNKVWLGMWNGSQPLIPMGATQSKIAFTAGCRRDLRTLFAADTAHRPRVAQDAARFGYHRKNWQAVKLETLRDVLNGRAAV
jgi:hypothetical protein